MPQRRLPVLTNNPMRSNTAPVQPERMRPSRLERPIVGLADPNHSKPQPAAQPPQPQQQSQPAAKAQPPPPQVPTQPYASAPSRASQLPSVAPRVSLQNGMLTIVAQNSTMADVISAVRAATKINIEGPPSGERMAARIGPAPVRDVLLSLFNGSPYDYIMVGAASDPNRIEHVVLTPRSVAVQSANVAPPQPAPQVAAPAEPLESDDDGTMVPVPQEQQDQSQMPQTQQPGMQPGQQLGQPQNGQPQNGQPQNGQQVFSPFGAPQQNNGQQNNGQQPNAQPATNDNGYPAYQPQNPQQPQDPNNPQVKTPEQLMQELRDMQMRRQQQQQNPDPNAPK